MRDFEPQDPQPRGVAPACRPGFAGSASVAVALALLVASCQSAEPSASPDQPPATAPPTTVETTTTVAPTTTEPATTTTTIAIPEPVPIDVMEGWELVWHDEFDGDAVDTTNWTYDLGGWGWGNGEAQNYTSRPENAKVENGLLAIVLRQEQYENSYYTSARLKTEGLHEFQYGRIEARAKVPRGEGTWPAFWMLGSSFERDPENPLASNWPQAGEIDIMEHVGRKPNVTFGTVHGPGYAGAGGLGKWNTQDYDIADDFHTYAVEWDESGITWFFDGEAFFELGPDDIGDREWVFDQPFFLIVNLALGGTFGGTIGFDIEYPLYFYVDHIRVYQRVDPGA